MDPRYISRLVLALVPFCAASSLSAADEFVGEVSFRSMDPEGKVFINDRSSFVCLVEEPKWYIRITPEARKRDHPDYHQFASDGSTLYSLTCFRSSIKNADSIEPGKGNVATSTVQRRRVPHSLDGHEVGPLWLAFASASYFQSLTNSMAEPAGCLGTRDGLEQDSTHFDQYPIQWYRQPEGPATPDWVVYFSSGTAPYPMQGIAAGSKKMYPPYVQGWTNSIFNVEEYSGKSTKAFAKRARFTTFGTLPPGRAKSSKDLYKRYEYVIETKGHAAATAFPSMPPALPPISRVKSRGKRIFGLELTARNQGFKL